MFLGVYGGNFEFSRCDPARKSIPAETSDVKFSRPSCPRGQNFVLGLGLEDLSSACPRTFYFGLVEMYVILTCKQLSTRCRASHCRSYDSSLYACSTL